MGNKEAIGIIYDEYIAKPRMYEEFRELFCAECMKCESSEQEINCCAEKINEELEMWIDELD